MVHGLKCDFQKGICHWEECALIQVRILWLKFSKKNLIFSLTRETDINLQFAKLQLLNNEIDQNTHFDKFPSAKWLFLYKFTSYLQLLNFWILSVSLVRENLKGFRENLRHKIWTWAINCNFSIRSSMSTRPCSQIRNCKMTSSSEVISVSSTWSQLISES